MTIITHTIPSAEFNLPVAKYISFDPISFDIYTGNSTFGNVSSLTVVGMDYRFIDNGGGKNGGNGWYFTEPMQSTSTPIFSFSIKITALSSQNFIQPFRLYYRQLNTDPWTNYLQLPVDTTLLDTWQTFTITNPPNWTSKSSWNEWKMQVFTKTVGNAPGIVVYFAPVTYVVYSYISKSISEKLVIPIKLFIPRDTIHTHCKVFLRQISMQNPLTSFLHTCYFKFGSLHNRSKVSNNQILLKDMEFCVTPKTFMNKAVTWFHILPDYYMGIISPKSRFISGEVVIELTDILNGSVNNPSDTKTFLSPRMTLTLDIDDVNQ